MIQQYRFLSEYLRDLADQAGTGTKPCRFRYEAEVAAATAGKEAANGDKCFWFSGSGSRYYVVLCDGMGTGLGASRDGETAGEMLRRLLRAGFPAEHALESLNSLCALRGRAGAVTVDLLELELDTGRATAYKWGAAPSYLLFPGGAEKSGQPPPSGTFRGGSSGGGGAAVLAAGGNAGASQRRRRRRGGPAPGFRGIFRRTGGAGGPDCSLWPGRGNRRRHRSSGAPASHDHGYIIPQFS